MAAIVLEVDDALAKTWRNASPQLRLRYEVKIIAILRELKEAKFDDLLDKAGKIAKDNGLTDEKLNKLLND